MSYKTHIPTLFTHNHISIHDKNIINLILCVIMLLNLCTMFSTHLHTGTSKNMLVLIFAKSGSWYDNNGMLPFVTRGLCQCIVKIAICHQGALSVYCEDCPDYCRSSGMAESVESHHRSGRNEPWLAMTHLVLSDRCYHKCWHTNDT